MSIRANADASTRGRAVAVGGSAYDCPVAQPEEREAGPGTTSRGRRSSSRRSSKSRPGGAKKARRIPACACSGRFGDQAGDGNTAQTWRRRTLSAQNREMKAQVVADAAAAPHRRRRSAPTPIDEKKNGRTLYGSRGSARPRSRSRGARRAVPHGARIDGNGFGARLAKVNPLRRVPTLVLPGRTVLSGARPHPPRPRASAQACFRATPPRESDSRPRLHRRELLRRARRQRPSRPLDHREDGQHAGWRRLRAAAASQLGDLRRHIRRAAV